MAASVEILTAIRELTNSKQIDRAELHGLLEDGINAALAKKHGPTVQAEVDIDENKGAIRIVLLKTVVEEVTDSASQISLEEARFEDPDFQIGDQMEIPVDFAEFGRTAVQAAKQRIIQRVREGERSKIRDEFSSRVGDLLSGEVQQIERGKLVIMMSFNVCGGFMASEASDILARWILSQPDCSFFYSAAPLDWRHSSTPSRRFTRRS